MPAKFIDADIDHVLSDRDFGETEGTVIWQGVTIPNAIFDDEDVEIQVGEGTAEIIQQPMITAKTSYFPSIREGDTVSVDGETFRVKNYQRDGTGMILIYLDRT